VYSDVGLLFGADADFWVVAGVDLFLDACACTPFESCATLGLLDDNGVLDGASSGDPDSDGASTFDDADVS
jgi:hypothetical protein